MKAVVNPITFGYVYLGCFSLTKPFSNSSTYVEAKVTICLRCIYRPHVTKLQKLAISRSCSHYRYT